MRRATAGLAAAVAAGALVGALAGTAKAHPVLVASSPAAGQTVQRGPAQIVVRLSEPAEPVGGGITVRGPDGTQVARGHVSVAAATLTRGVDARARGTYVVEWQVVGDDSHPQAGAFFFGVGEAGSAELPTRGHTGTLLESLGRWLTLLGYALGFGVPFAALLSGGMTPRLWRLVTGGIALMLLAEPVSLLGQVTALAPGGGIDGSLVRDVLETSYGHVAGLRLGAALGLWAIAGAIRQASPRSQWAIPALGAAAALAAAAAAHRIEGLPGPVALLVEAAHVAAFGGWLGCVVVAVVESRSRQLTRTAVDALIVLVASGAGLALGLLGTPGDLVDTTYGRALGLKLALVAVTLALGAAARRRAELAAALATLAAAGILVSLAPPL
jgi:copper transport protein